jgi:hypothetical protein
MHSDSDEAGFEFRAPPMTWQPPPEPEAATEYQERMRFRREVQAVNPLLFMDPLPAGCWQYGRDGQAAGSGSSGISGTNKPAAMSYVLFHCALLLYVTVGLFNADGTLRPFKFTAEDAGYDVCPTDSNHTIHKHTHSHTNTHTHIHTHTYPHTHTHTHTHTPSYTRHHTHDITHTPIRILSTYPHMFAPIPSPGLTQSTNVNIPCLVLGRGNLF